MFARIVQASLRNRAAVLLFTAVVVVAGFVAFRGLTIEALPDPTDTLVTYRCGKPIAAYVWRGSGFDKVMIAQ